MLNKSPASSSTGPTRPLKRGKACLTCRFLKIKCDGERPICGPCFRNPKDDPCEYADGPGRSRTKMLEEQVARLEARIKELEDPNHATPSMTLHDPYTTSPVHVKQQPASPALQLTVPPPPLITTTEVPFSPSSPFSAHSSLSSKSTPPFTPPSLTTSSSISPRSSSGLMLETNDELPVHLARELFGIFFPHASEFGFFLNVHRIYSTTFQGGLSLVGGAINRGRPSPCLMRTLYLWGAHLSRSETWLGRENEFLSRALSETALAFNTISLQQHQQPQSPSYNTLHAIQSNVLLAYYFFRKGRSVEARAHANYAASIVLSCGLHKIRSSHSSWQPTELVHSSNDPALVGPSEDVVEEGERINAFWAVLVLCKNLAAAFEQPANVCGMFETPGLQVDTPWPLGMESYEEGILPPHSKSTILDFLSFRHTESDKYEPSILACYTKACLIFHRACYLSGQFYPNMPPAQLQGWNGQFEVSIQVMETFRRSLPSMAQLNATDPSARMIVLSYALLYGATIRLHSLFAYSDAAARQQCLSAARAMLRFGTINMHDFGCVNPIMGTLWMTACQVFIDEISRGRSVQSHQATWSSQHSPSPPTPSGGGGGGGPLSPTHAHVVHPHPHGHTPTTSPVDDRHSNSPVSIESELFANLQMGMSVLSYFARESSVMSKSPVVRDLCYFVIPNNNPSPTNYLCLKNEPTVPNNSPASAFNQEMEMGGDPGWFVRQNQSHGVGEDFDQNYTYHPIQRSDSGGSFDHEGPPSLNSNPHAHAHAHDMSMSPSDVSPHTPSPFGYINSIPLTV